MQIQQLSASSTTSAPAGPNVHAKAFYFPLEMYHDESARIGENGDGSEGTPRRKGVGCKGWGVRLIWGGVSVLDLALLLPRIVIIVSINIEYKIRMGMGMGAGCRKSPCAAPPHTRSIFKRIHVPPRAIRESHLALLLLLTHPLSSSYKNPTTPTPTNHEPRYIRPRAPLMICTSTHASSFPETRLGCWAQGTDWTGGWGVGTEGRVWCCKDGV
jgi:hypothetical protein